MSTGTSIVGTWNTIVDWGCGRTPISANPFTFNSDGTWTYTFGGGRWFQVEGMVALNFENAAGLVYTANVSADAMVGIMGYFTAGGITGCFYGIRVESAEAVAATRISEDVDVAVGPQR